jgi:hypothetical protein
MKYIKLLLSVVFVSAQFLLSAQNQTKDLSSESKAAFQKLSAVYYLINNFYHYNNVSLLNLMVRCVDLIQKIL